MRDAATGRFVSWSPEERAAMSWPTEKTERFIAMYRIGASEQEIAAEFQVVQQQVSRRAKRLGLRLRRARWPQEQRDFLAWAWNVGIAVADIARDLGRTPGAVREQARLMGLSSRGRMHMRMPHPLPPVEEWPRLARAYMRTIGAST
jgi:hypothetical protein